jgi:hypothetical protein
MLLVGLAMFGVFFFNSLFIQNILGYSAVRTGATFLPMTVMIVLVAPVFGRLDATTSFWSILPGLIVAGIGMALTMSPTTATKVAVATTDPRYADQYVAGYHLALHVAAALAFAGAIVAVVTVRRIHHPDETADLGATIARAEL